MDESATSTSTSSESSSGIVCLVGSGPGDPGLITLLGLDCLRRADVVVYDRLVNRTLLAYAPRAEWIDVGKRPNHHAVPQEKINQILVEQARAGNVVVRLKGGDPFVFGRGGEEALALVKAGLPFRIVPGVTSAIAAPAYAGIPVTHRDVACSAAFITGHRANCSEEQRSDWRRAAMGADTLVFLMGVKNLPQIVEELIAGGRTPDTPVALIEQGSCATQKTVTGTLATITGLANEIKPPAVIIVGEVVALHEDLNWFERPELRPLQGLRVVNTRPAPVDESRFNQPTVESRLFFNRPGCLEPFSQRLVALGAEVLELPGIEISELSDNRPLDRVLHQLRESAAPADGREPVHQWLLFTSANAVHFFFRRFYEAGLDARCLAGIRIAVVGSATQQVLQGYRLVADFVPARFTARELAAELPEISGSRILLPRSDIAPEDLVQALQARGAQVEVFPAYQVRSARPNPEAVRALLEGAADVITFFSPSAVQGLAEIAAGLERDLSLAKLLSGCKVACIGPTTFDAARQAGLEVDVVAEPHTLEGMAQALIEMTRAQKSASLPDRFPGPGG